ncbi:major outer membrane protein [Campylobacter sp. MIT 19-121]|uniref:major outer membrane protein n=1 Tax=Campylobacter sp. MIT 19-121 TaxID=2703906 RepID=UPI00138A3C19|nr:major outer membrane protein [Campylobacter sp. MIT 19-121]NDJ26505.1 major outer membrane protein [Campylobacter sp. MIT 19-121]
MSKKITLSLAGFVALSSFASLNAISLEEAIKNVDFTGTLRYRYDTFREKGAAEQLDSQLHKMRAQLGAAANIGDGFKVVGMLDYNYDGEANDGGYGAGSSTKTNQPFYLREAYLQYDAADYGTSIMLGRQSLNTIWTDNDIDGSVGMMGKIINQSLEGVTLAAFAVDSVNDDGDFVGVDVPVSGNATFSDLKDAIFAQNLYGAAAIIDYSEQAGVAGQLWVGYVPNRTTLYAVDASYTLAFNDELSWGLQAQYLGNSTEDFLKNRNIEGGSLYTIAGTLEGYGFDGTLGYTAYGKDDATTFNVLEDMGDIITAGEEIQNANGSSLHGSLGKNQFVFASAGYTFNDIVRIGADYVFGGTKVKENISDRSGAGKKQEIVGRVDYNYSEKLVFSGFYSYITQKSDFLSNRGYDDPKQNNIRFQAEYKF